MYQMLIWYMEYNCKRISCLFRNGNCQHFILATGLQPVNQRLQWRELGKCLVGI